MNTKYLLIALLLIANVVGSTSVYAQKKSRKAAKRAKMDKERLDLAYIDSHEGFSATEVPEEWKGESAVILCTSSNFIYTKEKANRINVREMVRRRIKLQDKAAVEEFSEFYYVNVRNSSIGFNIIKPDGEKIPISSSEAIEVETEIPAMFQTYNRTLKYKKLAIPSLEIGDIIDYAYVYDAEKIPVGPDAFDPVIMTLSRSYPTVKQIVDFKVNNDFYLNFNSYNGAPELKDVALTVEDKTSRRYSNFKRFRFTDDMREKEIDEKWHYAYRSLPTIKFQVYYFPYSSYRKGEWIYFLGDPGKPNYYVEKFEIAHRLGNLFKYADSQYGEKILDYLKKYHKNETDKRKILDLSYYYFRHIVAAYPRADLKPGERNDRYLNDEISDAQFANAMKNVLSTHGITYDIGFAVPRSIGTIEEVLFPAELSMFVVAKIGGEEIILTNFGRCTNIGEIPFYLEGVESIYKSDTKTASLPKSSVKDNNLTMHTAATLNPTMDTMTLDRRSEAIGHNRQYLWASTIVSSDYLAEEHKKYPVTGKYEGWVIKATTKETEKQSEAKQREVTKSKEEENERRMEYLEEAIGSAIGAELTSYDRFEVIQDGRYHDNPAYIYEETFQLTDFVQKAGGNYIIEAGKLIDAQFEVEEDMLERNYDIYMRHARSYDNTVEFEIPEGYTVEGVEALNISVENETGYFKSTAKVDGNLLILTTNKGYKSNFESKENWDKMVDFLDAAYQFTQQKVVLKK